jgi:anti-anti-sigma factor
MSNHAVTPDRCPLPGPAKRGIHAYSPRVSLFELEHLDGVPADIAYVGVSGEVDLTNANDLGEQLAAVPDSQKLVVDLNRVVFIDSEALHGLFDVARRRGRRGVAFVIEPSAPIATTLAIVELDRAARVAATLDEARAALEDSGSA